MPYFYKSETLPYMAIDDEYVFDTSKAMLQLSSKEIAFDDMALPLIKQLDIIVAVISSYGYDDMDQVYEALTKSLNMDKNEVYNLWCINVCAVSIMNRITKRGKYGAAWVSGNDDDDDQ